MKSTLKKMFILFSLLFLTHVIVIVFDGLKDDENVSTKVAVILGSKVNTDGSLSGRLKARLDRGFKLYKDALVKEIYVSGGFGKEGHYEGDVMAEYLVSKGVPRKKIKVDNFGINTRSTAINFTKDYPLETSVVVVTQYFHVTRCKLAFSQVGIENVKGVHCDYFEWRDPYSIFREVAGLYKYLLFF